MTETIITSATSNNTAECLPWDRQPGESEPAYAAFLAFRDLGPGRTVVAVGKKLGKSGNLLDRWCQRHRWRDRAARYDADLDRQHRHDRREQQRRTVDRHAQAANALMAEVLRRLRPTPILDPGGNAVLDPNGQPYLRPLEAAELTAAASALDKAIRHQRLALGLPTGNNSQTFILQEAVRRAVGLQGEVQAIIEHGLCAECRARVAGDLASMTADRDLLEDDLHLQ